MTHFDLMMRDIPKPPFYVFADVEHSYPSEAKGDIIQLGVVVANSATMEIVGELECFACPADLGCWSWRGEQFHGISKSRAKTFPPRREMAIKLLHFLVPFKQEDNSPLSMVYHGTSRVDFRFIEALFIKENLMDSFQKVFSSTANIETQKLFKAFCQKNQIDSRHGLKDFTHHFGVDLVGHHDAVVDCKALHLAFKALISA